MIYFLGTLVVLLSGWSFWTFTKTATRRQIRWFLIVTILLVALIWLAALAMTGRLPFALFVLLGAWGLMAALLGREHGRRESTPPEKPKAPPSAGPMSRAVAFEILGLEEGATGEDIRSAYARLILKLHPDQGGTGWFAARLNEARAVLISDEPDV